MREVAATAAVAKGAMAAVAAAVAVRAVSVAAAVVSVAAVAGGVAAKVVSAVVAVVAEAVVAGTGRPGKISRDSFDCKGWWNLRFRRPEFRLCLFPVLLVLFPNQIVGWLLLPETR